MRGTEQDQVEMFSYISPEQRIPQDHPPRAIRMMVDAALVEMSPRFSEMYAATGRPSIAAEELLRVLVLQVLYTIWSERFLSEQLDCNLPFRWFVGLNMHDPVLDATVFTKNRQRLLEGDVARACFKLVLDQARTQKLPSDEHFTVDRMNDFLAASG